MPPSASAKSKSYDRTLIGLIAQSSLSSLSIFKREVYSNTKPELHTVDKFVNVKSCLNCAVCCLPIHRRPADLDNTSLPDTPHMCVNCGLVVHRLCFGVTVRFKTNSNAKINAELKLNNDCIPFLCDVCDLNITRSVSLPNRNSDNTDTLSVYSCLICGLYEGARVTIVVESDNGASTLALVHPLCAVGKFTSAFSGIFSLTFNYWSMRFSKLQEFAQHQSITDVCHYCMANKRSAKGLLVNCCDQCNFKSHEYCSFYNNQRYPCDFNLVITANSTSYRSMLCDSTQQPHSYVSDVSYNDYVCCTEEFKEKQCKTDEQSHTYCYVCSGKIHLACGEYVYSCLLCKNCNQKYHKSVEAMLTIDNYGIIETDDLPKANIADNAQLNEIYSNITSSMSISHAMYSLLNEKHIVMDYPIVSSGFLDFDYRLRQSNKNDVVVSKVSLFMLFMIKQNVFCQTYWYKKAIECFKPSNIQLVSSRYSNGAWVSLIDYTQDLNRTTVKKKVVLKKKFKTTSELESTKASTNEYYRNSRIPPFSLYTILTYITMSQLLGGFNNQVNTLVYLVDHVKQIETDVALLCDKLSSQEPTESQLVMLLSSIDEMFCKTLSTNSSIYLLSTDEATDFDDMKINEVSGALLFRNIYKTLPTFKQLTTINTTNFKPVNLSSQLFCFSVEMSVIQQFLLGLLLMFAINNCDKLEFNKSIDTQKVSYIIDSISTKIRNNLYNFSKLSLAKARDLFLQNTLKPHAQLIKELFRKFDFNKNRLALFPYVIKGNFDSETQLYLAEIPQYILMNDLCSFTVTSEQTNYEKLLSQLVLKKEYKQELEDIISNAIIDIDVLSKKYDNIKNDTTAINFLPKTLIDSILQHLSKYEILISIAQACCKNINDLNWFYKFMNKRLSINDNLPSCVKLSDFTKLDSVNYTSVKLVEILDKQTLAETYIDKINELLKALSQSRDNVNSDDSISEKELFDCIDKCKSLDINIPLLSKIENAYQSQQQIEKAISYLDLASWHDLIKSLDSHASNLNYQDQLELKVHMITPMNSFENLTKLFSVARLLKDIMKESFLFNNKADHKLIKFLIQKRSTFEKNVNSLCKAVDQFIESNSTLDVDALKFINLLFCYSFVPELNPLVFKQIDQLCNTIDSDKDKNKPLSFYQYYEEDNEITTNLLGALALIKARTACAFNRRICRDLLTSLLSGYGQSFFTSFCWPIKNCDDCEQRFSQRTSFQFNTAEKFFNTSTQLTFLTKCLLKQNLKQFRYEISPDIVEKSPILCALLCTVLDFVFIGQKILPQYVLDEVMSLIYCNADEHHSQLLILFDKLLTGDKAQLNVLYKLVAAICLAVTNIFTDSSCTISDESHDLLYWLCNDDSIINDSRLLVPYCQYELNNENKLVLNFSMQLLILTFKFCLKEFFNFTIDELRSAIYSFVRINKEQSFAQGYFDEQRASMFDFAERKHFVNDMNFYYYFIMTINSNSCIFNHFGVSNIFLQYNMKLLKRKTWYLRAERMIQKYYNAIDNNKLAVADQLMILRDFELNKEEILTVSNQAQEKNLNLYDQLQRNWNNVMSAINKVYTLFTDPCSFYDTELDNRVNAVIECRVTNYILHNTTSLLTRILLTNPKIDCIPQSANVAEQNILLITRSDARSIASLNEISPDQSLAFYNVYQTTIRCSTTEGYVSELRDIFKASEKLSPAKELPLHVISLAQNASDNPITIENFIQCLNSCWTNGAVQVNSTIKLSEEETPSIMHSQKRVVAEVLQETDYVRQRINYAINEIQALLTTLLPNLVPESYEEFTDESNELAEAELFTQYPFLFNRCSVNKSLLDITEEKLKLNGLSEFNIILTVKLYWQVYLGLITCLIRCQTMKLFQFSSTIKDLVKNIQQIQSDKALLTYLNRLLSTSITSNSTETEIEYILFGWTGVYYKTILFIVSLLLNVLQTPVFYKALESSQLVGHFKDELKSDTHINDTCYSLWTKKLAIIKANLQLTIAQRAILCELILDNSLPELFKYVVASKVKLIISSFEETTKIKFNDLSISLLSVCTNKISEVLQTRCNLSFNVINQPLVYRNIHVSSKQSNDYKTICRIISTIVNNATAEYFVSKQAPDLPSYMSQFDQLRVNSVTDLVSLIVYNTEIDSHYFCYNAHLLFSVMFSDIIAVCLEFRSRQTQHTVKVLVHPMVLMLLAEVSKVFYTHSNNRRELALCLTTLSQNGASSNFSDANIENTCNIHKVPLKNNKIGISELSQLIASSLNSEFSFLNEFIVSFLKLVNLRSLVHVNNSFECVDFDAAVNFFKQLSTVNWLSKLHAAYVKHFAKPGQPRTRHDNKKPLAQSESSSSKYDNESISNSDLRDSNNTQGASFIKILMEHPLALRCYELPGFTSHQAVLEQLINQTKELLSLRDSVNLSKLLQNIIPLTINIKVTHSSFNLAQMFCEDALATTDAVSRTLSMMQNGIADYIEVMNILRNPADKESVAAVNSNILFSTFISAGALDVLLPSKISMNNIFSSKVHLFLNAAKNTKSEGTFCLFALKERCNTCCLKGRIIDQFDLACSAFEAADNHYTSSKNTIISNKGSLQINVLPILYTLNVNIFKNLSAVIPNFDVRFAQSIACSYALLHIPGHLWASRDWCRLVSTLTLQALTTMISVIERVDVLSLSKNASTKQELFAGIDASRVIKSIETNTWKHELENLLVDASSLVPLLLSQQNLVADPIMTLQSIIYSFGHPESDVVDLSQYLNNCEADAKQIVDIIYEFIASTEIFTIFNTSLVELCTKLLPYKGDTLEGMSFLSVSLQRGLFFFKPSPSAVNRVMAAYKLSQKLRQRSDIKTLSALFEILPNTFSSFLKVLDVRQRTTPGYTNLDTRLSHLISQQKTIFEFQRSTLNQLDSVDSFTFLYMGAPILYSFNFHPTLYQQNNNLPNDVRLVLPEFKLLKQLQCFGDTSIDHDKHQLFSQTFVELISFPYNNTHCTEIKSQLTNVNHFMQTTCEKSIKNALSTNSMVSKKLASIYNVLDHLIQHNQTILYQPKPDNLIILLLPLLMHNLAQPLISDLFIDPPAYYTPLISLAEFSKHPFTNNMTTESLEAAFNAAKKRFQKLFNWVERGPDFCPNSYTSANQGFVTPLPDIYNIIISPSQLLRRTYSKQNVLWWGPLLLPRECNKLIFTESKSTDSSDYSCSYQPALQQIIFSGFDENDLLYNSALGEVFDNITSFTFNQYGAPVSHTVNCLFVEPGLCSDCKKLLINHNQNYSCKFGAKANLTTKKLEVSNYPYFNRLTCSEKSDINIDIVDTVCPFAITGFIVARNKNVLYELALMNRQSVPTVIDCQSSDLALEVANAIRSKSRALIFDTNFSDLFNSKYGKIRSRLVVYNDFCIDNGNLASILTASLIFYNIETISKCYDTLSFYYTNKFKQLYYLRLKHQAARKRQQILQTTKNLKEKIDSSIPVLLYNEQVTILPEISAIDKDLVVKLSCKCENHEVRVSLLNDFISLAEK